MKKTSHRQPLRDFIALLRPFNAAIAFMGILAAGFMAAGAYRVELPLLLAAIAGTFIGMAGNIHNDVRDIAIDRINKPRRVLAAGRIDARSATLLAAVFAAVGAGLSLFISPTATAIALVSIALLYVYNIALKHIALAGNVVVGAVTGAAFLYGAEAMGNMAAGVVPGMFAFLVNVGREIIKDVEDMKGDASAGARTLPILLGARLATAVAAVLLLAVVILSFLPDIRARYNNYFNDLIIFVLLLIVTALSSAFGFGVKSNPHKAATILKWAMLAGIVVLTLGSIP